MSKDLVSEKEVIKCNKNMNILQVKKHCVLIKDKFADSPLGKAFEKQTKTIEDQGEKQIRATEDDKKQPDNKQPGNNELLRSKEREIFKNSYNKRLDKTDELSLKN